MSTKPAAAISRLEDHLGYWMRHVSNHVSSSFAQALLARTFSVAEWVVMRKVFDSSEISAAELAAMLGMTRGAISKILDKLESKGMIQRTTRPEDQRSQRLTLTRTGRQTLPELAHISDRNDERFFGCLTPEERDALRSLLLKLVDEHHWNDVPLT